MRKNIKLIEAIILLSIFLLTSSKAELTNKVIMSVGNEIITNYDMDRETKYLSIITVGQFKNLDNQEAKNIATESLIKDKIKLNTLANYNNIIVTDEMVNNQIEQTFRSFGFKNIEDFKSYLTYEEYNFDEFRKKILLELKWNQLVYQFYKNQIVINKEKIDKQIKTIISEQKKIKEYLIYEIFVENTKIKKLDEENEKVLTENNIAEKEDNVVNDGKDGKDEIIIEAESVSYDNKENIIDTEKSEKKAIDVKSIDKITVNDIIKNIKEKGFENTAIKFSTSPSSQQGGKVGWVNENEFSEILIKHIKNTKAGNVSDPIPVSGGILIIKVEKIKTEESKIDFDKKMEELIEVEKNRQLTQFSLNYYNQVKNNIRIKYFDD